jgi:hypothetical protein
MKTSTENIEALFKEYGIQISALMALQEATIDRLSIYIDELDRLSASCLMPVNQTPETDLRKPALYIWENIGEGG